jgi:hypothetical protein
MRSPELDRGILSDHLEDFKGAPKRLGLIRRTIVKRKMRKAFRDRREELMERRGVVLEKRGWRRLWQFFKNIFAQETGVEEYVPIVETPIVVYTSAPAFSNEMLKVMDTPERAEHIRLAKLRRKIQPECEYEVLYYTEVPDWMKPHQYDKMARLAPPASLIEKLGFEGRLVSLTRARLLAREIAVQGCFGAIIGISPKGFHYEMFGGHDAFVKAVVKPSVYEKAYRLARDFDFSEPPVMLGAVTEYELVEGASEDDTPVLKPVKSHEFEAVASASPIDVPKRFANRD